MSRSKKAQDWKKALATPNWGWYDTPVDQKKVQLDAERKKRKKARVQRKAKTQRRLQRTALIRMVTLLPRDLILLISELAGWNLNTDMRVVILVSLRRTDAAKTAALAITNRKNAKAQRKLKKGQKKLPKRSPAGVTTGTKV